jgi:diketogulonate reductase-like aldo/keto reductase
MDIHSTVPLHSGREMPALGLGTWKLTDNTADTVAKALELGYTMIDTSGDYGTQPGIADGIKKSGRLRENLYIVTKVEETEDAYLSTQNNLRQLELDYADLMLIHRPPEQGAGIELWQGLIKAQKSGLAKDIGVSNYDSEQIQELIDATGEVPVVNQIEWSPFGHSDEMLEFCRGVDIIIQAYSPLTHAERINDSVIEQLAKQHSKTPAQILIRWNLQLGTVPLPKANREDHLKENLEVFDFNLSDEDVALISGLNENYSALGSLPYV